MVKKFFALASITALTGLVATLSAAGCSSTTVEGGGGAAETGTPVTEAGTKKEASAPIPGDEEEAPSTECKGLIQVDATKLPWKSPLKMPNACTEAELENLSAFIEKNTTAKYPDIKASVPAGCRACIFGLESATTWAPLLENAKGELTGFNVGGCIAIASNNDKCGQAYQQWSDCGYEACADCPDGDTAGFNKCRTAANGAKGGCKAALDNVLTVCTADVIDAAETACDSVKYVFEGPVKGQCIGLSDAGGGGG